MIGILKRDITIEWSRTGKKLLLPENSVIEGEIRDGFFYFRWRNVGDARLPSQFFSFGTDANWTPLNKVMPRSVFKQGNKVAIGERNANAKLSVEKAKEIRELLTGGHSIGRLAIKYGVSSSAIQAVKEGRTWNYEKESKEAEA